MNDSQEIKESPNGAPSPIEIAPQTKTFRRIEAVTLKTVVELEEGQPPHVIGEIEFKTDEFVPPSWDKPRVALEQLRLLDTIIQTAQNVQNSLIERHEKIFTLRGYIKPKNGGIIT